MRPNSSWHGMLVVRRQRFDGMRAGRGRNSGNSEARSVRFQTDIGCSPARLVRHGPGLLYIPSTGTKRAGRCRFTEDTSWSDWPIMRRDLYNLEGACHSIGAIAFLVTLCSRNIWELGDSLVAKALACALAYLVSISIKYRCSPSLLMNWWYSHPWHPGHEYFIFFVQGIFLSLLTPKCTSNPIS
jgi:hypothetical protein